MSSDRFPIESFQYVCRLSTDINLSCSLWIRTFFALDIWKCKLPGDFITSTTADFQSNVCQSFPSRRTLLCFAIMSVYSYLQNFLVLPYFAFYDPKNMIRRQKGMACNRKIQCDVGNVWGSLIQPCCTHSYHGNIFSFSSAPIGGQTDGFHSFQIKGHQWIVHHRYNFTGTSWSFIFCSDVRYYQAS